MQETPDLVRPAPTTLLGRLGAIGPGIVVIGSIMGSGELINTPVQAAKFGFVLLWAVIISCVIKYFLQIEFGRHALAHNRTPFDAFRHNGMQWVGILYMFGFAFALASFSGMLRATAGLMHSMAHDRAVELTDAQVATYVDRWSFLVAAITLFFLWRGLYRDIEKLITVLVGGFSVSVVIAVILIQQTDFAISSEQIFSGLTLSLGDKPELAAYAVVSLLGALGATANEIFMYPYWVLEKGYGAHVGRPDSEGWTERTRGWIRILQLDVAVCTILATVITAAYFLISAAVFYGNGDVPSGDQILDRLSAMFTESFGAWSYYVFVGGAFCTLFSTLIVGLAAAGRMWVDMFVNLGWMSHDNPASVKKAHRGVELFYIAACLVISIIIGKPEMLVIFAQWVTGIFCTPVLMIAIYIIARRTDERVRMNKTSAVCTLVSIAIIAACIIGSLVSSVVGSKEKKPDEQPAAAAQKEDQ